MYKPLKSILVTRVNIKCPGQINQPQMTVIIERWKDTGFFREEHIWIKYIESRYIIWLTMSLDLEDGWCTIDMLKKPGYFVWNPCFFGAKQIYLVSKLC